MRNAASLLRTACMILAASSPLCQASADDVPPSAPVEGAQGPQFRAQTQAANGPSPITLRLQYTGEVGENAVGGLHNGATYLNNILAQLHIDAEKALGWTGASFVLEGFYENANSLDTQYVGAGQDPSVIDSQGVAMFRLYQAYYTQDIGNTNVLFGIYDLETEFGATKPMDVFFNGAYAWNTALDQSGLGAGPSTYPDTTLALRIRQTLSEHWSIQGAVLDGVSDSARYPKINAVNINNNNGALLIAEADYTPSKTTKIMAGYWDYTSKFTTLNQTNPDGTARQVYGQNGGYIGGATRIYSQTARRGLDIFGNIGIAGSKVQEFNRSLNVGLVYTGLLDSRPRDRLGFAVGIAGVGSPYRRAQNAAGFGARTYETNFELTYRAPITRWLTVQPDIQYWINPNVDPALKNDLLLLIHFEVSHVFDL